MTRKILTFLLFFFLSNSFSQQIPLSDNAIVSVFTCGKGDELYTTFGHTAIRFKDSINNLDVVYNYGQFDFREGNFYLKFVKGDLLYSEGVCSYEQFIYEYNYFNREVIEQTLNLSKTQKKLLFEKLNLSLFSDDKYYIYKFIDRNCTTMVTEKINEVIGKPLIKKVDDKSISYRKVLYPYFENHFWYKLGINIIFGQKTDEKSEKLFLPVELMNSLDKAKIDGQPIVQKKEVVVKGAKFENKFSFFNSISFIILLLSILLIINNKKIFLSYLFVCGLLGIFLSAVGLYSLHQEVLYNYNALLFCPLFVMLPFLRGIWLGKIIKVSLILLLIYLVFMINKPFFILMLPFIIANGFILLKLLRVNKS